MQRFRIVIFSFIILLSSCCLNQNYRSKQAIKRIVSVYDKQCFIGVKINQLNANRDIFSFNEEHLFTPASTLKLFTSYLALNQVGKDYKFNTDFYYTGAVKDSILKGNIYLKASGDPAFGEKEYGNMLFIKADLQKKGIKKIDGDFLIITDNQTEYYQKGWMLDDLNTSYQSQISEYSYKSNLMYLNIIADSQQVTIENHSESSGLSITNNLKIGEITNYDILETGHYSFIINGTIQKNTSKLIRFGFDRASSYYLQMLKSILRQKDFNVKDSLSYLSSKDINPDTLNLLIKYTSPSLDSFCQTINKNSNNHYAEQIKAFLINPDESEENLKRMGINTRISIFDDGSGLSIYNKVTPNDFIKLLSWIYQKPLFDDYLMTLSIAGVDGTLKNRIHNPELVGRIYGKSGSMRNISNVVCYYHTKNDNWYAIVLLANNIPSNLDVSTLLEEICVQLK